jgi:hypothetical protein
MPLPEWLRDLLQKIGINSLPDVKKIAGPATISFALLVGLYLLGIGGTIFLATVSVLGAFGWFLWNDVFGSSADSLPLRPLSELEDGKPFVRSLFSSPLQGISYSFDTRDQMVGWLEATQKDWQAFAETAESVPLPKMARHARHLARLVREVSNDVSRNSYSTLKVYEKSCSDGKLIARGGTRGRYIFDNSFAIPNRAFAVGVFADAVNLDAQFGSDPNILPLPSAELLDEFQHVYPDFKGKGGEAQVLFDVTVRALGQQQEAALHLRRQREQFEDYLEAARVRSQLGPAASRWRSKARRHTLGVCVGLAPFVVLLFLPAIFYNQISGFGSRVWSMDQQTEAHLRVWMDLLSKAPIVATVVLSAPLLLFAWILRHFSRLFVRNLYLAADAGNRAAMADVYTRMIAHGAAFTHEQQTIIVQSLFSARLDDRHADGVPSSPVEQVIDLAKGKTAM